MKTSNIIITAALACEAKPLINVYGLKKTSARPFAHYCGDHKGHTIDLIVSGIGANAMATAVGWAGSRFVSDNTAWLNIGTAGHAEYDLGRLVLVNSCAAEGGGRTYYPPLVCAWRGISQALISMNAPSEHYPDQAMIDMEAYSFYSAACRFSNVELVQALKTVSDNRKQGIEHLNAETLSNLIHQNMDSISAYIKSLLKLANTITDIDTDLIQMPKGLHFSVTQQHQWKDLIRKATVMGLDFSLLDNTTSAKQAIDLLSVALDKTVPDL